MANQAENTKGSEVLNTMAEGIGSSLGKPAAGVDSLGGPDTAPAAVAQARSRVLPWDRPVVYGRGCERDGGTTRSFYFNSSHGSLWICPSSS